MTDGFASNWMSSLDIINSIIWPDSIDTIANFGELEYGTAAFISYSDIKGGRSPLDSLLGEFYLHWNAGNITSDPLFNNRAQSDFRLSENSPCIDAGTDSAVNIPLKDLAGDTRLRDGDNNGSVIIDMGAYEYGHPLWIETKKAVTVAPKIFKLDQNYPNPFNPKTTIEFRIPNTQFVTLKVYNILGAEVATLVSDKLQAGLHKYNFDGGKLASGVYYYQVMAGEYREVKKMILLR
jgi:hypothetical protein